MSDLGSLSRLLRRGGDWEASNGGGRAHAAPLPHPRHRDGPEVVRLRGEVLGLLGVPS